MRTLWVLMKTWTFQLGENGDLTHMLTPLLPILSHMPEGQASNEDSRCFYLACTVFSNFYVSCQCLNIRTFGTRTCIFGLSCNLRKPSTEPTYPQDHPGGRPNSGKCSAVYPNPTRSAPSLTALPGFSEH